MSDLGVQASPERGQRHHQPLCHADSWLTGTWARARTVAHHARGGLYAARGLDAIRAAQVVRFDACFKVEGADCNQSRAYTAEEARRFPHATGLVYKNGSGSAAYPVSALLKKESDFRQTRECDLAPGSPVDPRAWEWLPDGCQLRTFDASLFCNWLGERGRALFVGDSIQSSLYSAFRAKLIAAHAECYGRIDFRLNIGLTIPGTKNEAPKQFRGESAGKLAFSFQRWDDLVRDNTSRYRLVVANAGARQDKGAIGNSVESFTIGMLALAEWLKRDELRRLSVGQLFVWRGQLPGHAHCQRDGLHPLRLHETNSTDPPAVATAEGLKHAMSSAYQWRLFPKYDDIARRLLVANNASQPLYSGVHMLDLYSPYSLRPDAHVASGCRKVQAHVPMHPSLDCLHWAGGALDTAVDVLLHKLLTRDWRSLHTSGERVTCDHLDASLLRAIACPAGRRSIR